MPPWAPSGRTPWRRSSAQSKPSSTPPGRLQLARGSIRAAQAPIFQKYRVEMTSPIDLFARLTPPLEDIKALSGSTPEALDTVQRVVTQIVKAGDRGGAAG